MKNVKKIIKQSINHNSLNFYAFFLKCTMRKGKISSSINIFNQVLSFFITKYEISIYRLFLLFYARLKLMVEIKKIKKRKTIYLVPFKVTKKRRLFLMVALTLLGLKRKKEKTVKKLILEFYYILTNDKLNSKALVTKKKNVILCLKHKSNLHYRW